MSVKINGVVHTALMHLKDVDSIKGYELAKLVKAKVRSLYLAKFEYDTLQYMVEQGWVLKDGDVYSLAAQGKLELEGLNTKALVAPDTGKVKHKLFVADASAPPYKGESMICQTYREGAFDYAKCNSIINGKTVPYHLDLQHV